MTFTVRLGQSAPVLGDVERNLEAILRLASEAADDGADLLVLPELALTGYTLKDMVPAVAQRIDSPAMDRLREASRDVALVMGFVEESDDYRYYNAVGYFESGELLHVHRKVYLPTYGMFDEYRYMAAGERIRAFDSRLGRVAMLICEDVWHPSAAYIASQDGATLLISVACSPARGTQDALQLYSSHAWQTLNRMYAHFFTQHVVFVNRVGYEDGVGFWGGSEVVGPEGDVLVRGPLFEECSISATISAQTVRRARIASPFLRDERLDLTLRELERIQRRRIG